MPIHIVLLTHDSDEVLRIEVNTALVVGNDHSKPLFLWSEESQLVSTRMMGTCHFVRRALTVGRKLPLAHLGDRGKHLKIG